jgi:nitrate/nitrite transport system substrate-binding protein
VRTSFPAGAFARKRRGRRCKGRSNYIALTDSAPLIIAKEKGLYAKAGCRRRGRQAGVVGHDARQHRARRRQQRYRRRASRRRCPHLIHTGKVTQNNPPLPVAILARLNLDGQAISVAKALQPTGARLDLLRRSRMPSVAPLLAGASRRRR